MSRKVLVVDDEKLIVKGLRFSLEQDGMEVDCAYDGEEALEKANASRSGSFPMSRSSCLPQKEKTWIRFWAWNTEQMIM